MKIRRNEREEWIPVNANGQLWKTTGDVLYGNVYAIVLNNKPFTFITQFESARRTWYYDKNNQEITGHREIIYLV